MKGRLGTQIDKHVAGEQYQCYIPAPLPPEPAIDIMALSPLLEKASAALATLSSQAHSIPNTSLFLYIYVRKEALLSSQIEGTQSSLSDLMLFEHDQCPNISLDDVEEVSNYVKAIKHGCARLEGGFPLSLRLLKEVHQILLAGARGANKLPGELRHSQNWIGGTRPGNALFVPPPVDYLNDCLSNLEKFIHDKNLPTLIKAALAHVQFETIHPFLDGNGRLGRLLITLLFIADGLLTEPVLYLSLYLKQNRQTYYNLLQEVRTQGNWETWIEFFLTGITESSQQATEMTRAINQLLEQDQQKLNSLGRAQETGQRIFTYLKQLPQVTVPLLSQELELSAPTIRNAIQKLVGLGILCEVSHKKRDRIYVYQNYLDLLELGAEPTT